METVSIYLSLFKNPSWINCFTGEAGSFANFARSYKRYGLNVNENGDIEYREWAPAAKELSLV